MMRYEEFVEEFKERLGQLMQDQNIEMEETTIKKVNEDKQGLVIKTEGNNVAPVVYLDDQYGLYQEGKSISEIAFRTSLVLENAMEEGKTMGNQCYSLASDNVYAAVVNYEKNEMMLKDVPHRRIEDLAVIPRYRISDEASFIISNDVCNKTLHMTREELLETACKNNSENEGYHIDNIAQVISNMTGQEIPEDIPLYVITNKSGINGAAAIVDKEILEETAEKIGGDYFILPSSRHEILALPKRETDDIAYIKEMVGEINSTVLRESDFLSNNVYLYDSQTKQISLAEPEQAEIKDEEMVEERVIPEVMCK